MTGATAGFRSESCSDLELADGLARGDPGAVRLIMQCNDQRLYRAARRIVHSREDAEDAVQIGYLKAYVAISGFAGRSSLSTWLTRIVINTALAHARTARREPLAQKVREAPIIDEYCEMYMRGSAAVSPERAVAGKQVRHLINEAIARLPAPFRAVFILRQIEDLDVAEVAKALGIPAATVKTRDLRARRRLRRLLGPEVGKSLSGEFSLGRDWTARPAIPSHVGGASSGWQGAST